MPLVTSSSPTSASVLNASDYNAGTLQDSGSTGHYGAGGDFVNWFTGNRDYGLAELNNKQSILDRQFMIDYDNSKYQRAVKDLEAAGLNKWSAVQNGLSASSASASGSHTPSQGSNQHLDLSSLLTTALKIAGIVAIGSAGTGAAAGKLAKTAAISSVPSANILSNLKGTEFEGLSLSELKRIASTNLYE